nr:mapk-regulated corepressor-interacting protein 1 isoform X2 [Equus caballus]
MARPPLRPLPGVGASRCPRRAGGPRCSAGPVRRSPAAADPPVRRPAGPAPGTPTRPLRAPAVTCPAPRRRVRAAASLPAGPQLAEAAAEAERREPHGYQGIQELSRGMQRPRGSGSGVQGPDTPAMTSSPVSRVVYNGKRNSSPRSPPNSSEIFTPAHEENVRFIYEAWQGVERDLRSQMSGSERGLVEEYVEKVPNPSLKTFKPIDLSDLKRRNTQDTKKS